MSNTIQIKRGAGKPDGKLAPYELGYDINSKLLYIGGDLVDDDSGNGIKKYGEAQGIKVEYATIADRAVSAETAETAETSNKLGDFFSEDYILKTTIIGENATEAVQRAINATNAEKAVNAERATDATNAINATNSSKLEDHTYIQILQAIYPVGAIYISTVSTSPAELFGFGTWERIQDTFLLAAGDKYLAGSTGGEAEHTLTEEEMPIHSHNFTAIQRDSSKSTLATGSYGYESTEGSTENTGGGQAHNNMPPYLAVYIWKRTV